MATEDVVFLQIDQPLFPSVVLIRVLQRFVCTSGLTLRFLGDFAEFDQDFFIHDPVLHIGATEV